MSARIDITSFDDLRRTYGHVPGMQEALDAYLAEKHVARCAGVPPDVANTYSRDVFKDKIEKILAQLMKEQRQPARGARPHAERISRNEEGEGTSVMPAIGWWPDSARPTLFWDLSSSNPPRYSKRDFSPQEYQSSPFNPSLRQIRIVLDDEAGWSFTVGGKPSKAAPSVITLGGLFNEIAEWMQTFSVPWSFWMRASSSKRRRALRGFQRRTGQQLSPAALETVGRGSLDKFVMSHSHREQGWTIFRGSDLLGDDVLFWGLAVSREPDEWQLKTTHA